MTRSQRIALVVILLSAAVLRLTGLDWDGLQHHHPDERYISWVATTIDFPSIGQLSDAAQWQPNTSTFNPFHWPPEAGSEGIVVLQGEPRDFAYGHVPLYLGVLATRLVERTGPLLVELLPADWSLTADVLNGAGRIEFHHLTIVGRALTALFDLGTVLFTFLLGRRLYNPAVGLLAAALLAVAVLHIQLSHFFTSDPYLTFFVVAAIYFMVAAHEPRDPERTSYPNRQQIYLALAAVMVGLAIGSKFTAVLLGLPLLWTVWGISSAGNGWRWMAAAIAIAGLTFAVTNPFALLDWTCLPGSSGSVPGSITNALSRSCYLQNVLTQNAMVRGQIDLGFTRQYDGTMPYLYYIEMLLRWGLGLFLGVLSLIGLGWAVAVGVRSTSSNTQSDGALAGLRNQPVVTVLLWVLPYLILTGSFYVKFMRYLQPAVPFMVLFGAAMLWHWRSAVGRYTVAFAVLTASSLYAISFTNLYADEHPWNAASRWIYENVPSGTMILSEQWDDYLPVPLTIGDDRRLRSEYPNAELTWLTYLDAADSEENLMANLELLAGSDYLTILSNRVYGVVPRQPERFPLSSRYHQLLFDGALGYELAWVGGRSPQLFGFNLRADTFGWPGLRPPGEVRDYLTQNGGLSLGRADESFIVYDQPLTMIFRNEGRLSAEQMLAVFAAAGD